MKNINIKSKHKDWKYKDLQHKPDALTETVYNINYGEYKAIVYLNRFLIDKGTMAQIHKMLIHPATNHMRIMPDCHRGSGCCVGYTSYLTTKIVPKFIGGDIGCGMICYPIESKYIKTNLQTEQNLEKIHINNITLAQIDKNIRSLVPMGTGNSHSIFGISQLEQNKKYLHTIWTKVQNEAYQFAKAYKIKYDQNIDEFIPDYGWEWYIKKCIEISADCEHDLLSLGTLGGGNHFIEINVSDKSQLFVTVHCGSRNIGQKICQFHQNKINETKYFDRESYNIIKKKTERKIKGKQFYQIMEDIKSKLLNERHPDYLEKDEAYKYYFDMIFAQNFAELNRNIILEKILNVLSPKTKIEIESDNIIESIHNYIDFDDFIVRKGAIRASLNKKCVIALNMRDGILLCHGKGNHEWNYSAAHGAGRVINRQEAYNKLKFKNFQQEMKNVYSTSVQMETLDESPMVYRDVNIIKDALEPTVNIIEQLRPLINLKGSN